MANKKQPVPPKNVLLDTQVFDAVGENFQRPEFGALRSLVGAKRAKLFITSVIDAEVRNHLAKQSQAAQNAIRNILKEHSVLQYHAKVPFHLLTAKDAIKDLTDIRVKQWEAWLFDSQVTILDTKSVTSEAILDLYFKVQAPFAPSEQKKHEFPDAFTLEAVRQWCRKQKLRMYIVSGDKAFDAYAKTYPNLLDYLPTLTAFLAFFPNPELSEKLRKALIGSDTSDVIISAFQDHGFFVLGAEGQVEEVRVNDIEFDEFRIAEAKAGKGLAEVECHIEYEADVEYEETGTGIYDKEEQRVYFSDVEHATIEESDDVTALVHFSYSEPVTSESIAVDKVTFPALSMYVDITRHLEGR